jgi:phosphohistidine swiveling domain-containing protein
VPDLTEDPAGFFVLLRNALAEGTVQRDTGGGAQAYLDEHLEGSRRRLYDLVRGKVRRSLASRERLRFCRTRAFGTAKKMLRAIGRDFAATGVLDDPADIYFLYLEEIRGCFEATSFDTDLRTLVATRKAKDAADRTMRAPSRFSTTGAVYWLGNLERGGWRPTGDPAQGARYAGEQELTGVAAGPGTATARARVVDTPREVDGDVLVTYRTDPGWVASLPSASALLIERGSPLTHVAIVARELGVPTVVQIKDLTERVRTGMLLRVDGNTGTVRILPDEQEDNA